jgi:hypothetical protein
LLRPTLPAPESAQTATPEIPPRQAARSKRPKNARRIKNQRRLLVGPTKKRIFAGLFGRSLAAARRKDGKHYSTTI